MAGSNEIRATGKTESGGVKTIEEVLDNKADSMVLVDLMADLLHLNGALLKDKGIIARSRVKILFNRRGLGHHLFHKRLGNLLLLLDHVVLML